MLEAKELGLFIILVMLFSIIMGIGMIMLNNRNRKIQILSEKLIKETEEKRELEKLEVAITTQEKERSEIARLLHDDVGARLSIVLRHLSNMEDRAELGESDLNEVSFTKGYVKDSVEQIRQITKGLVPHYLLKFGLVKALERMSKQKTESLIDSFVFLSEIPDELEIPDVISMHYFYLASELMTNLLKHSYPTSIELSLEHVDAKLKMNIKHNGIALTQRDFNVLASESDSFGLENIKYRLKVIKGKLTFTRNESCGMIELETVI
jgi:two-component system NarL family sensor kinase